MMYLYSFRSIYIIISFKFNEYYYYIDIKVIRSQYIVTGTNVSFFILIKQYENSLIPFINNYFIKFKYTSRTKGLIMCKLFDERQLKYEPESTACCRE